MAQRNVDGEIVVGLNQSKTKNILEKDLKGVLSGIKNLEIKIDKVNTTAISKSIKKAIKEAYKNIPTLTLPSPNFSGTGGTTSSARGSGTTSQVERIQKALSTGTYSTNIDIIATKFKQLGVEAKDINTKLNKVRTALSEMNANDPSDKLISGFKNYDTELQRVNNDLRRLTVESKDIDPARNLKLSNDMQAWLQKNSKAAKDFGADIESLRIKLQGADKITFNNIKEQFENITHQATLVGKLGKSFSDTIKEGINKLGEWGLISEIVLTFTNNIRNSVIELKEIDTILTQISKTSDLTAQELKELGNTSFESASKYGKTAGEYLTGVQEMSRSGFYGEQGEAMAEQSLLAQAAGDLTPDVANSYIIATNAAYKLNGEAEKLNAVLDGQNSITNRNLVALEDMATAMSEAGTTASNYHVAIEDLSAMIGTIEAVTKSGGSEVGNAIKSILINLQNVTSDKIPETLDKANASMTEMVNGAEKLRNPIAILRDLANTFNTLDEDDPLRAEILTNVAGKYQASKLAALLQNMDMFDKMLVDYSEGSGSAMEEAQKSANNLEGSLNTLSNSWTEFVNTLINSDELKTGVIFFNDLVQSATNLVNALTPLGTIGLGAGLVTGTKNIGITYECM